MDTLNVSTEENSITQTNILPENEIFNDDSSWVIENNSEIANDAEPEQQTEDHSTYDIFQHVESTPLQTVLKKREEEIAAKDVEENSKISTLREHAKTDLERWYRERERQLEQKFSTHRIADKTVEKSSSSSNPMQPICDWSKVISFLDLTDGKQSSKSKRDLTRMKECLFNAKRMDEKKKIVNGNSS